jgi:hypothetical protein
MGACGACSVSSRPRGDLLTHVPFRGLKLNRARDSYRSRVLRGMGACSACSVSSRPRGDLLTPVPFRGLRLSQGLVSLEGPAYLARNRAIKCSAVEAVISRRGRAFLGVAAARARSGRRGQADVTAATVPAILRRDDGLFAVSWPPRSWWGPPVSEKEDSLQLMRAGRPLRRARPRLINLRGEEDGGFLP